jgi:hypothetical protein
VGEGRSRWAGVAAWALWALAVLGIAALLPLDRLLEQAGRAELFALDPFALPGAAAVALYYTASALAVLSLLGFVLLLTPTGSLPPGRAWRPLARCIGAVLVAVLLALPFAPGRFEAAYLISGGTFAFQAFGGVLLAIYQVAVAVALFTVVLGAWSLVVRFRHAHGVERQHCAGSHWPPR